MKMDCEDEREETGEKRDLFIFFKWDLISEFLYCKNISINVFILVTIHLLTNELINRFLLFF